MAGLLHIHVLKILGNECRQLAVQPVRQRSIGGDTQRAGLITER